MIEEILQWLIEGNFVVVVLKILVFIYIAGCVGYVSGRIVGEVKNKMCGE